jgi:20S proteasome subunit alpha 2
MGPDFRILVAKARKIAQAYYKVYGEYPPTKVLVQEVAGVLQKATQSGYVHSLFAFDEWARPKDLAKLC